jgi:hypothetical protein
VAANVNGYLAVKYGTITYYSPAEIQQAWADWYRQSY